MSILNIHTGGDKYRVEFSPGPSLLDLLRIARIPISSGCAGGGACARCKVIVEAGQVDDATPVERLRLSADQLKQGMRLACQIRPQHDLQIRVAEFPVVPGWKRIVSEEYGRFDFNGEEHPPCAGVAPRGSLGVALDIGTTRLKITLWDKAAPKRLTGRSGPNPQSIFGSDVMSRVIAACESQENADRMADMVRDAVGDAIREMTISEGCDPCAVDEVVIAGNTAMLALLSRKNYRLLSSPDHWSSWIDCRPESTGEYVESWGLAANARVKFIQPLAGFVGSDLLAGVLATGLTAQKAGSMLVDFGTNSEIALWDGRTLWVTSAAGGPAFEGCGIQHGMPAEPGAICRVTSDSSPSGLRCEVIGGGAAQGICGSGLVDAIAFFLKSGKLTLSGQFARSSRDQSFLISGGVQGITLSARDVDAFQRAKAAIGGGMGYLLSESGMNVADLERVYVCGALGNFLRTDNARAIGLLPDVADEKIMLCGNAVLAGCERLLLSSSRAELCAPITGVARMVNLAESPFESLFIENLYLKPMRLS